MIFCKITNKNVIKAKHSLVIWKKVAKMAKKRWIFGINTKIMTIFAAQLNRKENMKRNDPIEEARRYVENAKETLQERGEFNAELNRYDDEKYVRAAGNYLWLGVLMALDAVFHVREDRRTRADIRDYKEAVGKRDRKLLALVNDGYDTMHLSMNYDGNQSKDVSDGGFRLANAIIDRCAAMVN